AALASPETAERIALMEAATDGGLSAVAAARLSLRRAGQDATVLDGLLALAPAAGEPTSAQIAEELLAPLGLGRLGSREWGGWRWACTQSNWWRGGAPGAQTTLPGATLPVPAWGSYLTGTKGHVVWGHELEGSGPRSVQKGVESRPPGR